MIDDVHVIVAFYRKITKTTIFEDSHARFFGHDITNDRFHRVTPPYQWLTKDSIKTDYFTNKTAK